MILVTGATGNVGAELVRQLAGTNQRVRALVRKEASDLPAHVERAGGNLDQPESLSAALAGIRRVFLLGGYRSMPALLSTLRRAGVEHVTLLSSRSVVGGNPDNAIVAMWLESEAAVRASGIPWTILQPSSFMSNALRWLPQLRTGDRLRIPFADIAIAAIDPADIAAVAARTLTSEGHRFQTHVLSGPTALLPLDQVRILATVLGRPLRLEAQSDEEARAELNKQFPPSIVEAFFRFYAQGEFDDSVVVPAVRDITGQEPRTFEQWAQSHAAAFR